MDNNTLGQENSTLTNTCDSFELITWMLWISIPACLVIILFSFLEQRVNLWPTCLGGRPGVVFPVNVVDSYTDRWSCAFAFGSMSPIFTKVLFNTIFGEGLDLSPYGLMWQGTLRILLYITIAFWIGLIFYPILLCLSTTWTVPGNTIGFLFSFVWFVNFVGRCWCDTDQDSDDRFNDALAIIGFFATGLVCFLALMIRFLLGIVKDIRKRGPWANKHLTERWDFTETHFYQRVKFLLSPPQPESTSGNIAVRLFQRFIGTVPGFRFSRGNVCSFVLTVVTTAQVATLIAALWGAILNLIMSTFGKSISDGDAKIEAIIDKIRVTFWVSIAVVFVVTVLFMVDVQLRYRKHTLRLWKGDCLICQDGVPDPGNTVVASLRHTGYQVAFAAWGFIIMTFVLWAVLVFVVIGWEFLVGKIKQYWLALVITFGIYYGQLFIVRLAFLQRAPDQEKSRFSCRVKTHLALDNRRVFHVTVFITLIVNFLLGLMSCFTRIVKAIAQVALFVGRLDRCILMEGFQSFDPGFGAYIGFLQLEVAHTHPVLVTFCHFMLQTVGRQCDSSRKYKSEELVSVVNTKIESGLGAGHNVKADRVSRRIRNKWLVALTLTRNPRLVAERKVALLENATLDISKQYPGEAEV